MASMLHAMSETVVDDPAAGFAALMNKAAEQAAGPADEAPYGYTVDPDGTRRPKKVPGRPRKSPSIEELRAAKDAAAEAGAEPAGDRAPDSRRRPRTHSPGAATAGGADGKSKPVPQFREGQIERGINNLYRKAGRMIRVADQDVGQALIDITRKDDAEDVTVGEAWEQLARTNPRIRGFLLRLIAGGAVGQLFMCHAPVLMAVLMKDAVRKRLPFPKLAEAFLTPDEDGEAPADGTPAAGLTVPDLDEMMAMARSMTDQAMARATANSSPRAPEEPVMPVFPGGLTAGTKVMPDPPLPVA